MRRLPVLAYPASRKSSSTTAGGELGTTEIVGLSKRTRETVLRVRTGCLTCKIRHLKCGEEKPACERCRKDGMRCDGYIQPIASRKSKCRFASELSHPPWKLLSSSLNCSPAVVGGGSSEQYLLHHVIEFTITELSACTADNSFWTNQVLQQAHHAESIKHALLALGAAHRSFKGPGSIGDWDSDSLIVQHYNKAIRHVVTDASSPSASSMKNTIICCLIFVCIENVMGRFSESIRHLRAGSKLLTSYYQPAAGSGSSPQATQEKRKQESDDIIESLSKMFSRLGMDVALFLDSNIIALPDLFKYITPSEDYEYAQPYESLVHAKRLLDQLDLDLSLCPSCPWNLYIYDLESYTTIPVAKIEKPTQIELADSPSFDNLRTRFENWRVQVAALMGRMSEKPVPEKDLQLGRTMLLHEAIFNAMFAIDICEPNENDIALYEAITYRAEKCFHTSKDSQHPFFTFDADIISPLTFVCTFCPEEDIQRRCISLLRAMKRKEGIWDSSEIAEIYHAAFIARKKGSWNLSLAFMGFPELAAALADLGVLQLDRVPSIVQSGSIRDEQ